MFSSLVLLPVFKDEYTVKYSIENVSIKLMISERANLLFVFLVGNKQVLRM